MKRVLVAFAVMAGCGAATRVSPTKHEASAPPARVALPPRGVATCGYEASFPIASRERLLLGERTEARFTGREVGVRVTSLDTDAGLASVTVHAPSKSPALRLDGKVASGVLPLRAARDVSVAGDRVVIPRGTPVRVTSGEGTALGIEPRYGDFSGVATLASCDDVALVVDVAREPDSNVQRRYMHVTKPSVIVFDAPDGAAVIELGTRHEQPTVHVVESRGAFHHVRYDDGVRIDGWMRASDLAPGEGPDCDDCHGWVMDVDDVCLPECPDAKGGPFHASHKVAVRDRPSPDGAPLGWLEEDGEVRIVGRKGSYARVEAVKSEIIPPDGGLWIDEGILRPREK